MRITRRGTGDADHRRLPEEPPRGFATRSKLPLPETRQGANRQRAARPGAGGAGPASAAPVLTLAEVARLAGVSRNTVRYWVRSGLLFAEHDAAGRRVVRLANFEAARARVDVAAALRAWRRDRRAAGQRLRTWREAAGLSQLDLAAVSGVTHETISRLELGRRAPTAETAHRLARALETTPGALAAGNAPVGGYLTTAQAGASLRVGEQRVRRWIKAGALPAVKVSGQWRVPAPAVFALKASGRMRGRSRRLDPRFKG